MTAPMTPSTSTPSTTPVDPARRIRTAERALEVAAERAAARLGKPWPTLRRGWVTEYWRAALLESVTALLDSLEAPTAKE